jgi:hypothetical protein
VFVAKGLHTRHMSAPERWSRREDPCRVGEVFAVFLDWAHQPHIPGVPQETTNIQTTGLEHTFDNIIDITTNRLRTEPCG